MASNTTIRKKTTPLHSFLSHTSFSLLCLGVLASVGCSGGSGEGLDISGRPNSEGGNVPLAATLASVQANVFNPSCIGCHSGAAAPQGLRLDSANSFSNLVGVPSREVSALRVSPGNPNQSYLIQKLEGTASVGEQMPLGGPPLSQETINFVRQWIIDGALADDAQSTAPPVVTSVTPDSESTTDALPAQILIGFDQDVDASTVNALTVTLSRSGNDGSFVDGNEESIAPLAVAISNANSRLAVMDLSGVASQDDTYQIAVKGSGPSVVLGIGGTALDGEFNGTFPSGDGAEGGDFASIFTVQSVQPTLASIQENVFTPICSGCHTGPAGPSLPAGMNLSSEAASLDNLFEVASLQQGALFRVSPADADNSYLIQKLEGTAASGQRMPLGGPFLPQSTIDAVRTWINNGANP